MSTGFSLEVVYVDGRVEQYECEGEQTTIGSSIEADLALNLPELSPRHLLIVPRAAGCWVSVARGVATPVLLAGIPVDSQEVPWDSELDIGTVTLRLKEPAEVADARAESQRSLIRILGMAALAVLAFYFLQDNTVAAPRAPASAPELFDDNTVECSLEASSTIQRGRDLNAAASAYWQRYPFDSQEGIRANRLYKEAARCFSKAGQGTLSKRMDKEHADIESTMNRDYQNLRLQLSRALKNKEHKFAKGLVADLFRFTQHRPGEYVDWLARVERYLRNATK